MGRLRIVVALGVVAGLAGVAYWYWTRPRALPEAVVAAQRALATPDALALVSVDVAALAALEPGDGTGLLAEARRQLAAGPLGLLEWERDASYLVAALYRGPDASLATATVLVGRFEAGALESALSGDARFRVVEGRVGSERVWTVARNDPDSCEPAAEWVVHAGPEHVAIADPRILDGYLQRMRQATPNTAALEDFERFATGRLVSAVLLPRAGPREHPVVAALRQEVEGAFGSIEGSVRLGLTAPAIPGSVKLEIELEVPGAEALAARWSERRDALRAAWSKIAPTLATLHDGLAIEGSGSTLRAAAKFPREMLASGFRIPDELLVLASRSEAWRGSSADVKMLDARARVFRAEYPLSSLPRYDPKLSLAGPGDVVSGPFGLQVRAVRRGAGPGAGLELEIEADAPALANFGESALAPRLAVSSVRGKDGRELLVEERCGPDRNARPAELQLDASGDWMRAKKTVRIAPGAGLDSVAWLSGYVELSLPVRTESETLPAELGAAATRDGVRVEITGIWSGSFSYRVSGEAERVLEVRGLGALSHALPVSASWTQDLLFGAGRVGTRSLRGELEAIEVIFSAELKTPKYAFRFDSVRPGTDREEYATQSARFVEYSPEQYAAEFAPRFGVPFRTDPPPRARTTAGPFTLALRDERRGSEEASRRLHVLAPDIPNLSYNLTALELNWQGHRVPLRPRYRFGREELTCAVNLDALALESSRLEGELVLRLARDVEASRLAVLEPGQSIENRGVRLEVIELGRDRFTARIGGDATRLIAVAAFDADGRALVIEPLDATASDSGLLRSFCVSGQATQLEVQVASSFERMAYPFQLDWAAPAPAAPAP